MHCCKGDQDQCVFLCEFAKGIAMHPECSSKFIELNAKIHSCEYLTDLETNSKRIQ